MKTDNPQDMERLASRRNGVLGMIVGMTIVLLAAYLSLENGSPSPKANATLFFCGMTGLMIIGMGFSAEALTSGDKARLGLLCILSATTLLMVDYGRLLSGGGRVATPLGVGLSLALWHWWRGHRA